MLDVRFAQRMNKFLAEASAMRQRHHTKAYPELPALNPLEVMEGQRYVRVFHRDHGSRYCYCFVDKTNGDVLKSESWKKPAKHARSSIWDEDYGLSGLGPYGAKYLK